MTQRLLVPLALVLVLSLLAGAPARAAVLEIAFEIRFIDGPLAAAPPEPARGVVALDDAFLTGTGFETLLPDLGLVSLHIEVGGERFDATDDGGYRAFGPQAIFIDGSFDSLSFVLRNSSSSTFARLSFDSASYVLDDSAAGSGEGEIEVDYTVTPGSLAPADPVPVQPWALVLLAGGLVAMRSAIGRARGRRRTT